jgi:hypothetical protein
MKGVSSVEWLVRSTVNAFVCTSIDKKDFTHNHAEAYAVEHDVLRYVTLLLTNLPRILES